MFSATQIPYSQTKAFSALVNAYVEGSDDLRSFYPNSADLAGIKKAVISKAGKTDRRLLVNVLQEQYKGLQLPSVVNENIRLLADEKTFTICTAHQPNLATGPLYVIYKTVHAIRLAEYLNSEIPGHKFVPVFYIGSEDADKEEINHFNIAGKKYEWITQQTGAVGRMKVDQSLVALLQELNRQAGVWKQGEEWAELLSTSYCPGSSIQESMMRLMNALFGEWGLITLNADHPELKRKMTTIFSDDLFQHHPSRLVTASCEALSKLYHVQANPREINLFYLKDDKRERIEKKDQRFEVCNTDISFSEQELKQELNDHPERFSPNVILRGIYQETILPNVAFIGGGGEIAYWLQLRSMFDHYKVDFPVLVLRNSYLVIEKNQHELLRKLQLTHNEIFDDEISILNRILEKHGQKPQLNGELKKLEGLYDQLQVAATGVDASLSGHVAALKKKAIDKLLQLENKMLRAERKKIDASARQLKKVKQELFPNGGLQERVENVGSYYGKHGKDFISGLLENSPALDQQFTILTVSS